MPNAMTQRFCTDLVNEAEKWARELELFARAAHSALAKAQRPDADSGDVSRAISDAQRARAAFMLTIKRAHGGGL
jgi:hypothetical protein